MKSTAPKKIIRYLIADFSAFIAILLVFCYFHHVRRLMGKGYRETTPVFSIQKPTDSAPADTQTPTKLAEFTPTAGENAPIPTDTPAVPTGTPTPICDDNGNPYDFSGDFGDRFGKLFSADDTIIIEDNYYRSHDLFVTLTRFDGYLAQRTKKSSSKFEDVHTVYFAFDIYIRNIENFYTTYCTNSRLTFENLLKDSSNGETVAAVSGDLFYGYESSKEVIIRNGNVIRISDYISGDICVLYWDGFMEVISPDGYDKDKLLERGPYQVWSFGPGLLDDDGAVLNNYSSPIWIKNPRSSIGMVEPGHYVFIAVAGIRDQDQVEENGYGITLESLGQLFAEFGCVTAYNLDGGASSYAGYNGDILFSVERGSGSTRLISDIICVGEPGGMDE